MTMKHMLIKKNERVRKAMAFALVSILSCMIAFGSFVPLFSHAAISSVSPGGGATSGGSLNPIQFNTLQDLLYGIIQNVLIPIGTILVVVYLIYAGFLLVSARGDEKQVEKGKSALFNAVIGAFILLGAQAIALMIQATVKSIIGG